MVGTRSKGVVVGAGDGEACSGEEQGVAGGRSCGSSGSALARRWRRKMGMRERWESGREELGLVARGAGLGWLFVRWAKSPVG